MQIVSRNKGAVCNLSPLVGGEKSRLYNDILNRVGTENRSIANFFYAISKTDDVKAKFTSKDLNSQGEIETKKYLKNIDIEDFLSDKKKLDNIRKEEGAIKQNGEVMLYDSPDELYDKVLKFNEEHTNYRANIKYLNGKFALDINMLGADNFQRNSYLKGRKAEFDIINQELQKAGFSTDYDNRIKSFAANFLNSPRFLDTLSDISRGLKRRDIISPFNSLILSSIMKDNKLFQRLKAQFGDSLGDVISYVSGDKTVELTSDVKDRLEGYWNDEVNSFIDSARVQMGKLDIDSIKDEARKARIEVDSPDAMYYGAKASDIHTVLSGLYKKFHLNAQINSSTASDVTSLSEAAKNFQNKIAKEVELMRQRKAKDNGYGKILNKMTGLINRGKYFEGVATMFTFVQSKLNSMEKQSELIDKTLKGNPDTLQVINRISGQLIDMIEFVSSYKDIVEKMMDSKDLDIDQAGLPSDIKEQIAGVARSLNSSITEVNTFARNREFDCVYDFLKIYWGDSDSKFFEGKEYSLAGMLKIAENDIGLFSRLLYSANETSDPIIGLCYEAIKERHRARDEKVNKVNYVVRTLTTDLYKEGNSDFMYERGKDGKPTLNLINNINWDKFREDREKYKQYVKKEDNLSDEEAEERAKKWTRRHTKRTVPFGNSIFTNAVSEYAKLIYGDEVNPSDYMTTVMMPDPKEYSTDNLGKLTAAQRQYYFKMMALKSVVQNSVPGIERNFFLAPQITASMIDKIESGDTASLIATMKENFMDNFRHSAEDYGDSFDEVLAGNDLVKAVSDMQGHELETIPILYQHRLKDSSRLSTDFSRGMMATAASSIQYEELNNVLDSMMLAKDWITNQRQINETSSGQQMMDIFKWGRQMFMNSIFKNDGSSNAGGLLADFYEKELFGKRKKAETIELFGYRLSIDKAADFLTSYTSITGLTTNLLGAEDNLLVGKMQMIIESGAGEFFNFKDMSVAELQYFQMLPEYMAESGTTAKASELRLLMDKFDAMEDVYEKQKNAGFHKSAMGRIIGNGELMFMYNMGEHMLHGMPLLAVLRHEKVWDSQTNTIVPALNMFYVEKNDTGNGILKENRDRYKAIDVDEQGKTIHRDIEDKDIDYLKKRFKHVSKTMNGAFNDIDKGAGHRYALMRLVMNFRQWMPGFYGARLRGVHYDADIGQWRRGFYTSAYKFLGGAVRDLIKGKARIATSWNELTPMDQYNLKRAISEVGLFALLTVSNLSLGQYKDKRGNWAYRHLMYMTKRLLMETQAASPVIMPFSGYGAMGFVNNMITTLNSPMAAINSMEHIASILDFTNIAAQVQNGKDKGENLYWHNFKKDIPFYGSVTKQLNLGNEDYLFNVFKQQ